MYTIDDENNDLYEEEYETSRWDNYKGLIFKIIIIILCIIVLIWLIKALKNNKNNVDNGVVHVANTEKLRLASEDYFFLKDNKKYTKYVSLGELKSKGYITDLVDANNKVCSDSNTKTNLVDDIDTYKMTITFACSTNDKEEVFYYHKNTLACLNCNGKTYMDGKTVVIDDEEKEQEVIPDNPKYTCYNWSDWTKTRENDKMLIERKKVLVQGVKKGNKTVYGDWSEYVKTPIIKNDGIEVEEKIVNEEVLGEVKSSRNVDTSNPNIRIISTSTVTSDKKTCKDGNLKDNNCYSTKEEVGNLTFEEYLSGKYKVNNGSCEAVRNIQNSNGRYELTYINCRYNRLLNETPESSESYTVYNYQLVEKQDVKYYRYRTVSNVSEPDVYTDKLYEEDELPEGYTKVKGSEVTYYSYKDSYCEK